MHPSLQNKGFFQATGFVEHPEEGDISIGFLTVPGAELMIEIMEYHAPEGRKKSILFQANDVSG